MYQQQGQAQSIMPEGDLAYIVLSDLKRVVGEYTTAATESSCQQIRQMFTNLLNSTLQMQGQLYKVMEQQNMYSTSSPALRQELDKQIKQNQQMAQKTNQFLQQLNLGQGGNQQFQQQQQAQQYQPYQQQMNQPSQQGQSQYYS